MVLCALSLLFSHLWKFSSLSSDLAFRDNLYKILGYLKANVSKNVGKPIWQRNYYEHIIRDEEEHIKIKEYIRMNPEKWCRDMNNPVNYK